MVSFTEPHGHASQPRLKNLQQLQEEIYRQFQLLIPDTIAYYSAFESRIADSPPLRMEVLERHRYTIFLRLTYAFNPEEQAFYSPNAHLRLYNDARIAEVTSFDWEQGTTRLANPWYPPRNLLQKQWRLNATMDKWLTYILNQGHSLESMQPSDHTVPEAARTGPRVTVS